MQIEAKTERGVLVLTPDTARLDASSAAAFRETLIGHIEGGAQSMVIDLSRVGFIDSSALGALIAAVKKLGPLGVLAVAGVQPAVARLFAITRMDRVFSLHAGADEAVARLASG